MKGIKFIFEDFKISDMRSTNVIFSENPLTICYMLSDASLLKLVMLKKCFLSLLLYVSYSFFKFLNAAIEVSEVSN